MREEALEAISTVLSDPTTRPEHKLKAAESILDRFVPRKAETKLNVEHTEARDLDDEILEILGVDTDAEAG